MQVFICIRKLLHNIQSKEFPVQEQQTILNKTIHQRNNGNRIDSQIIS